jgi:IstB-like ATP binding protein
MLSSRLPVVKQLRDFDFTFQPSLRREQIESLHELGFVERRENVILLGPSGVSKNAPGDQSRDCGAQSGRRVYYGTLAGFDHLTRRRPGRGPVAGAPEGADASGPAGGRRDRLSADSRTGAMLSFQLMTRRYEHASTVLTSNKGFEEWGEVFGDDVMAAALIDRVVHQRHLVTIRGNSYRMRQYSELWQALHTAHEPEIQRRPPPPAPARQEATTT